MSFLNALGLAGTIILAVLPLLIVLLYFLKLRRKPLEVPSTLLWRRTLEDMHVNSLWQRLRNNLLIWLQVLAVLLMLLAGLRPGCKGEKLADSRFVFLVDNSASMAATDLATGTRLDEAKRQLLATIDRMQRGDEAMLITFSDAAEVTQSFTNDLGLLRRRAAAIRQSDRRSDVTEALVAASGLANPGRTSTDVGDVQVAAAKPATLMIFSDGAIRKVPDFSMGNLTPDYRPVGSPDTPANAGITAFSLSDSSGGLTRAEAFAQLFNGGSADATLDVSLYAAGQLFDSQAGLVVPPRRPLGVSFDLTTLLANLNEPVLLELKIETTDALAIDNVARLVVNPPAPAKVLVVSADNEFLRLALSTEDAGRQAEVSFQSPEFLSGQDFQRDAALGLWSLVIFDRVVPDLMPQCNTLILDGVPVGAGWTIGDRQFPTGIVDIDRSHPVMSNLQLGELAIVEARPVTGPAGTQTLLEATYGPIIAIGPRAGFQDLVIGFPLTGVDEAGNKVINTNWPSQLSFPLFVQNVLRWLATGGEDRGMGSIQPGQLVRLRAPAGIPSARITTPDGDSFASATGTDGSIQFSQTDRTGVYSFQWDGAGNPASGQFAVNLQDPNESTLAVREQLELGFEKVAAVRDTAPARREYWRWIVLLATLVLAAEWFIYNRRVLI